jgi:hypothetical protein
MHAAALSNTAKHNTTVVFATADKKTCRLENSAAVQQQQRQQNSRAHAVQEARVVGHNDGCDCLQVLQVVLQPCDVPHVQMVGGLIQQQDVGL